MTVRTQQEDGAAVALEQHHRVIHQSGQDAVEVEPRPDVAGHPAERLGPVEQVGDLVGPAGAGDERPDGVGDDPGDVEVARAERSGRLADDEQGAPRLATARDGDRQLRPTVTEDGRRRVVGIVVVVQDAGSGFRPVRSRPAARSSVLPMTP